MHIWESSKGLCIDLVLRLPLRPVGLLLSYYEQLLMLITLLTLWRYGQNIIDLDTFGVLEVRCLIYLCRMLFNYIEDDIR